MDLLDRILSCKDEEVDSIIEESIIEHNLNATQVSRLGFLNIQKSNSVFKGFIPLNTRIKYANLNMEDYSMQTTDFIYEFAHVIRKYNIKNKTLLIYNLEVFINKYFGYPGRMSRETVFNDQAWNTTTTDEEYFEALKNNKIGDLKGKGAAECTERGAVAEQLLSLFGIESYYCMGCIDLPNKQEGHCFNIVKRKNDYALLDYSVPVISYNEDGSVRGYFPFVGILSNEEFSDFINNGTIKSFDEYYMNSVGKEKTGEQRKYAVGKYQIKKENTSSINH